MADVGIKITVDSSGNVKLTETAKKMQDIEKAAQSTGEKSSKSYLTSFQSLSLYMTGINQAINLFGKIGSAISSFIQPAIESEKVYQRLGTTIDQVGGNWKKSKSGIEEYLAAIQKTTTFSDEQAAQALERMVTLTGDVQGSMKNLGLVIDMASVPWIGLEKATQAVSFAMEGNIGKASRLLPEMKELDKMVREQAKTMGEDFVPSAELSATAMSLFTEKFGSKAQSEMQTMAGQVKNMGNMWDEFKEKIAFAILGIDEITNKEKTMNEIFNVSKAIFTTIVSTIAELAGGMIEAAGSVVSFFGIFSSRAAETGKDIFAFGEKVYGLGDKIISAGASADGLGKTTAGKLIPPIVDATVKTEKAKESLSDLDLALQAVSKSSSDTGEKTDKFSAGLDILAEKGAITEGSLNILKGAYEKTKQATVDNISMIIQYIGELERMGKIAPEQAKKVLDSFQQMKESVTPNIETIITSLQGMGLFTSGFTDAIKKGFRESKLGVDEFAKSQQPVIDSLLQQRLIVPEIAETMKKMFETVNPSIEQQKGVWDSILLNLYQQEKIGVDAYYNIANAIAKAIEAANLFKSATESKEKYVWDTTTGGWKTPEEIAAQESKKLAFGSPNLPSGPGYPNPLYPPSGPGYPTNAQYTWNATTAGWSEIPGMTVRAGRIGYFGGQPTSYTGYTSIFRNYSGVSDTDKLKMVEGTGAYLGLGGDIVNPYPFGYPSDSEAMKKYNYVEEIKKLFPSYQSGGYVPKTGLALVHEGETVLPAFVKDALSLLQVLPELQKYREQYSYSAMLGRNYPRATADDRYAVNIYDAINKLLEKISGFLLGSININIPKGSTVIDPSSFKQLIREEIIPELQRTQLRR